MDLQTGGLSDVLCTCDLRDGECHGLVGYTLPPDRAASPLEENMLNMWKSTWFTKQDRNNISMQRL